jgi:hypothetical protein
MVALLHYLAHHQEHLHRSKHNVGCAFEMLPKRNESSAVWQAKLKQMIPSYGKRLSEDKQLTKTERNWSHQLLGLNRLTFV